MDLIFALILLLLALGGVVVRKTYYYLPAHELKRRAQHDKLATQLYRAVAYGSSLRVLLWLFIALTSAGGVILLTETAPWWLCLIAVIGLLWAAYSWLPASRVTKLGATLTTFITPLIAKILSWLHPHIQRGATVVEKTYSAEPHTGIFERDDLFKLIERQQQQADSRITPEELDIVRRALQFSDRQVAKVLTARKDIKTVLADDTVGPILIDEVHKSGQDYVLVRESKKGPVIGTLEFGKLGLESKGHVRDLMNPVVYYLHENDSLSEALHIFFATNHSLFIVVNSHEEYLGIITIENILRELLGHMPGTDFDQYTDLSAVAARHTKPPKAEEPEDTPVKPDEEVLEYPPDENPQ